MKHIMRAETDISFLGKNIANLTIMRNRIIKEPYV